jgi:biotin transport system substrate-specific component
VAQRSVVLAPSLVDAWWPERSVAADAAVVGGLAALTALSAQVEVHLWFTPVPITGQTFAFLLAGAVAGGGRGALSQVLYLLAGIAGLPVFAGASAGLGVLVGPSGGYLLGGLLAAYAVGRLTERGALRNPLRALLAMVVGEVLIYAAGLAGLSRWVSPSSLLTDGLIPFIPGDLIKMLLAAGCLPAAWRLTAPRR